MEPSLKKKKPPKETILTHLRAVGAWARIHLTALVLSLAGFVTGIAAVVHFATPAYRAMTIPNVVRDARIAENAEGLRTLTTQVNTWHTEQLTGDVVRNATLKETGDKVARLATAVEVQHADNISIEKRLEEQSRLLTTIIPLLARQAKAETARTPPVFVTMPQDTIGPPAPDGGSRDN